ncbi:hypothetical protein CVT24_009279 [Panaeolus cyanescens]|uniref:DUF6534 domain-containing protein n=1 Tax=Panaeolus cyanescens TaxID=181874 RepID=A0A409Y8I2_9AGAR|nr:hypothetical protein CVT24_009279 [Panaeolus cyanescens]
MSTQVLNSTLGAAFLGSLAAAVLYGVTSVQIFLYFQRPQEDGKWFRLLCGQSLAICTVSEAGICLLRILDTVHMALTAHGLYVYLITNFGNYDVLLSPTWAVLAQVYPTNISDIIKGVSVAFSVWVQAPPSKNNSPRDHRMFINSCIRLRNGICAVACLVTYAIWPQRFIFMGLYFALSKLYVNSLLASLNTRGSFRAQTQKVDTGDEVTSTAITFPRIKPDQSQSEPKHDLELRASTSTQLRTRTSSDFRLS